MEARELQPIRNENGQIVKFAVAVGKAAVEYAFEITESTHASEELDNPLTDEV